MLAYRIWDVMQEEDGRFVLRSPVFWEYRWREAVFASESGPGVQDEFGIYAYTPDAEPVLRPIIDPAPLGRVLALGAIDAYGTIIEHTDGVIRAEYARVLALRVVPGRAPCGQAWIAPDGRRQYHGALLYCNCCDGHHSRSSPPRYRLDAVEEWLLDRYRVPRLPEDAGPWTRW